MFNNTKDFDINVFYSSATHSGKNPFRKGGNGGGWKLDGDLQDDIKLEFHKGRMIYGSASCFNSDHGFSKQQITKMLFINNTSSDKKNNSVGWGNPWNWYHINAWDNQKTDDPYVLKCEDFKKIKTIRSFDIPLEEPKYHVVN